MSQTTKKVTNNTQDAANAVEETMAVTKESMESAAKATQEAYSKGIEGSMGVAREQLDKAGAQIFKSIDDASSLNRDNMNAWVNAVNAMSKGMEDFSRSWFTLSKSVMEHSLNTTRSMMAASSVSEVVDLHSSYAKSTFDSMISESTRLSEMSLKTANDTMAPLSERMNAVIERIGKPAA